MSSVEQKIDESWVYKSFMPQPFQRSLQDLFLRATETSCFEKVRIPHVGDSCMTDALKDVVTEVVEKSFFQSFYDVNVIREPILRFLRFRLNPASYTLVGKSSSCSRVYEFELTDFGKSDILGSNMLLDPTFSERKNVIYKSLFPKYHRLLKDSSGDHLGILLSHPNIIKTYSMITSKEKEDGTVIYRLRKSLPEDALNEKVRVLLLESFPNCRELYDLIIMPGKEFTIKEVRKIIYQLTCAINYIQENGFWHRDIKPENVLIDEKGNVKLIDFTFLATKDILGAAGSVPYFAPELLIDIKHNDKSDFWSLGCVIYSMLRKKLIFSEVMENRRVMSEFFKSHRDDEVHQLKMLNDSNEMEIIDKDCFDIAGATEEDKSKLFNLLKCLLDPNVETRLAGRDVLAHPFFSEC